MVSYWFWGVVVQDFKKLKVWEKSHRLTLEIYKVTQNFPPSERYGLVNQMRRASASIPTNIAEGTGRNGKMDLARFLQISMGSASELEYQLILAHHLNFIDQPTFDRLTQNITEIKKMLASFIRKLKTDG